MSGLVRLVVSCVWSSGVSGMSGLVRLVVSCVWSSGVSGMSGHRVCLVCLPGSQRFIGLARRTGLVCLVRLVRLVRLVVWCVWSGVSSVSCGSVISGQDIQPFSHSTPPTPPRCWFHRSLSVRPRIRFGFRRLPVHGPLRGIFGKYWYSRG